MRTSRSRPRPCRRRARPSSAIGVPTAAWVRATKSGSCRRSAVSGAPRSGSRAWRDARRPSGVDGVHAFVHPFGCSQLGDDLGGTRAILAALACHPNAAGVLIVGLGCESNQLDALLELIPGRSRAGYAPFARKQRRMRPKPDWRWSTS